MGPIEILLVLFGWIIPMAILAWFIMAIKAIRDSLHRIERHLEATAHSR